MRKLIILFNRQVLRIFDEYFNRAIHRVTSSVLESEFMCVYCIILKVCCLKRSLAVMKDKWCLSRGSIRFHGSRRHCCGRLTHWVIGRVGAGLTEWVRPHDTSGASLVGPCVPTLIKSVDFWTTGPCLDSLEKSLLLLLLLKKIGNARPREAD